METHIKNTSMKKKMIFMVMLLMLAINLRAQYVGYTQFPLEVNSGLNKSWIMDQYYWDSPMYKFTKPVDGLRITFTKATTDNDYNGFPIVALAELTFYDYIYRTIEYSIDDITYNSLEGTEGSLQALYDDSWSTYYHSAWKNAVVAPDDYVYIDVKFPEPVSTLCITMVSRNLSCAPSAITITPTGVRYDNTPDEGNAGGSGSGSGSGSGEDNDASVDYIPVDVLNDSICYVYLADGGVDAYQKSFIDGNHYIQDGALFVPLADGEVVVYNENEYDSCSTVCPQLPYMVSYKFNNKYNPNLNVDAEHDSVSTNMNFTLNAIGKSLTASFNLSDDRAVAYIDSVLQYSKESRTRFDSPIHYVVTYPGYNVVQKLKISDEVWEYGEDVVEEIPLVEDMLYTNKPSLVGDALGHMLDGNPSTVFHTVFGANYDATVTPYFTITLDEPVELVKFYYMSRTSGNYNPQKLSVYVSTDNVLWRLVKEFTTENDALPLDPPGAEYTSPAIDLGGSYRYIKIEQNASEYHNNHMVFAEFRLYNVVPGDGEPVKVQDAVYKTLRMPFGRIYTVDVDWLTDKQNAVPRIDIDVENGYSITSKTTYRKANFRITGYGVYDDFEDSIQVRGRGNSTWSYPKKPYRVKFAEKRKPFGLTNGKNWVLLANYQRGSLMANAIAMKIGQLAQAPYTNHIIPVELYVNGVYVGSYMFTENIGFSNNSVDIDEDKGTGYMLELDDYYDETYKFKSDSYGLPVNVKEPDLEEIGGSEALEKFYAIQGDFNRFESSVFEGRKLSGVLDVDACARFMLTNDFVLNQELGHPKSTYLWREDMTSSASKIIFGPLWDFDWAFGYEGTSSYCVSSPTAHILSNNMSNKSGHRFFKDLMQNEEFKKHYYKVWKEFVDKGCIKELIEYLDDYYNFAKSSFENNYYVWYDGIGYAESVDRMQEWLQERHDYIVANIEECDITELIHPLLGDVDCNDNLTVRDIALCVSYIYGNENSAFNFVKADIDNNKKVNTADVSNIASQVLASNSISSLYNYNTPLSDAYLSASHAEIPLEEAVTLPLSMYEYGDGTLYKAVQMDVTLPTGVVLVDAVAGERSAAHTFQYNQIDDNKYRILIYSDKDELLADGEELVQFTLSAVEVVPDDNCKINIANVLLVDSEDNELRAEELNIPFSVSTSIDAPAVTLGVRGGDYLTISSLVPQDVEVYSVDGCLVRLIPSVVGTVNVNLPSGVYIVSGNKVVIY